MIRIRLDVLALAVALAAAVPAAQTQRRPPPRASGIVQAETTAISSDAVVRDKHGQPVVDLTTADFELTKTACFRKSARDTVSPSLEQRGDIHGPRPPVSAAVAAAREPSRRRNPSLRSCSIG